MACPGALLAAGPGTGWTNPVPVRHAHGNGLPELPGPGADAA